MVKRFGARSAGSSGSERQDAFGQGEVSLQLYRGGLAFGQKTPLAWITGVGVEHVQLLELGLFIRLQGQSAFFRQNNQVVRAQELLGSGDDQAFQSLFDRLLDMESRVAVEPAFQQRVGGSEVSAGLVTPEFDFAPARRLPCVTIEAAKAGCAVWN